MISYFVTGKDEIYERAKKELHLLGCDKPVLKDKSGKPYIEGNELYISVSHSGSLGCFALSSNPIGVDLEMKEPQKYKSVLSSFTKEEREEIKTYEQLLCHLTVREAYVKLTGEQLWKTFTKGEYIKGEFFLEGVRQDISVSHIKNEEYVISICE